MQTMEKEEGGQSAFIMLMNKLIIINTPLQCIWKYRSARS